MDSSRLSALSSSMDDMNSTEMGGDSDPRQTMEAEKQFVEALSKSETRKVRIWRRNVLIVLGVTGALLTTVTYLFLLRQDTDGFDTSFERFASIIRDSTEVNLRGVVASTNGIAQVFTSEAIKTNSEWPFVTLSSFEVFVRNTRAQASTELVVVAPFVEADQIGEWNDYANKNQGWIDESFEEYDAGRLDLNPIPSSVYRFGRFKGRTVLKPEDGFGEVPVAPFWQMSRPPYDTSIINFNSLSEEAYQEMYNAMISTRNWVLGPAGPNVLLDYTISEEAHDELHAATQVDKNSTGFANNHPHTSLFYPIFRDKNASHASGSDVNSPIVAMIINILPWDSYLKRLLPDSVNGIDCVLRNTAGQSFTYHLRGSDALYLGPGDLHETSYDNHEFLVNFTEFFEESYSIGEANANGNTQGSGNLQYWLSIYPSEELENSYETHTPAILTAVLAGVFIFMILTFLLYDYHVTKKNNTVMAAATQSNAILTSLFPKNVKERLLEEKADEVKAADQHKRKARGFGKTTQNIEASLERFMAGDTAEEEDGAEILASRPIAELFPETTIMFADLVGFTSWSSTRSPVDVFTLLETLYRNFDFIAKRKRVYKVETIGDCYVAVTGCPTPNKNHHIAMCRFAQECLRKMRVLTKKLESKLGPDTSSLDMRFGLHSGSVTGGVLRGERSRFQLFGDTMNTAARMESNGQPGKIHLSSETAELLRASGKESWLVKRQDKVHAKGKGELQTWWLGKTGNSATASSTNDSDMTLLADGSESEENEIQVGDQILNMNEKTHRIVNWTAQSLLNLLERLAVSRKASSNFGSLSPPYLAKGKPGKIPLEELQEVLSFHGSNSQKIDNEDVVLSQDVEDQMEVFVGSIAGMYPASNGFHNFDHASHVTMTTLQMFSKMSTSAHAKNSASCISSDLLAVFACSFAALIHDVQHPSVPNFILKAENPSMAAHFKGRCIAEQNSFALAWELLAEDRFTELRGAIFCNKEEAKRFRQLVINAVMATDLFDPKLCELRTKRWEKAFQTEGSDRSEESPDQISSAKATVVFDHVIQASDISHTMQHWLIYRKWNACLFAEMYQAFLDGRTSTDPAEGWYNGELWFFDNHVIPLAKRLKQIGCFGLSGAEYVKNAEQNRMEWSAKGRDIVAEMLGQKNHKAVPSTMTEPSIAVEHLASTSEPSPAIEFVDELSSFADV